MKHPCLQRCLVKGLALQIRALDRVEGTVVNVRRALSGLWARALSVEEKQSITVSIYDRHDHVETRLTALFSWEEPWLERELPPTGRVLVCAAGRGRELRHLLERGLCADALEPSPRGAAACRALLGDRGVVAEADYDALARAVDHPVDDDALARIAHTRYDAVLYGWGSPVHLPDRAALNRALGAGHGLCPRGPLLVSYWDRTMVDGVASPQSRAFRIGGRVGERIGRLRRLPRTDGQSVFLHTHGFVRPVDEQELDRIAQNLGRSVRFGPKRPYPHATLAPPST